MPFSPTLAAIRFGTGLSPDIAPPTSSNAMLAALSGPDTAAADWPIEDFPTFRLRIAEIAAARKQRRQNRGTELAAAARETRQRVNREAREAWIGWLVQHLRRRITTPDGLRERLAFFWADHFTARGKAGVLRRAMSPYIETAIRPHVAGSFADLLKSAVTHPMMLAYLDQITSMGPNSERALKTPKNDGLNENLAREVLELHTLGVGGPYGQDDVRQLAELFTGLSFQPEVGFKFRKDFAEPGPETVLGKSYGGDTGRLSDIHAVLDDLAVHPATARHIATKLARHFVSDTPDPALVGALEAAYTGGGGALLPVYETLLGHPSAWDTEAPNVKQPFDFVASACRALAVDPASLVTGPTFRPALQLMGPLGLMGQPWERPQGPDGWPEDDAAWITPQGVTARLRWAMTQPRLLRPDLPDPRAFVETALGGRAPDSLLFAAGAAEERWVGIGLVLSSPAFQRL